MIEQILTYVSQFGVYSLWLFTLALTLASSVILLNYYLNSKGTPLGRTAFYFFLNSFWWSVTSALISIPIITTTEFVESYFYLFFPFMAGIASILGTYERSRIQSLLQPGTKKQTLHTNLWFILSFCIFCVALIAVIGAILNIPILNAGMGGLTGLVFMLIGGLLIALAHTRANKLVYIGAAALLTIGFTVIIGLLLEILPFYSPLPGRTGLTTALVFVIVGFWVAIAKLSGLKWWIVKMVMSFSVLSSIIITFVTYLFYHSPDQPSLSVLLMILVCGALLWRSWKMQSL